MKQRYKLPDKAYKKRVNIDIDFGKLANNEGNAHSADNGQLMEISSATHRDEVDRRFGQ